MICNDITIIGLISSCMLATVIKFICLIILGHMPIMQISQTLVHFIVYDIITMYDYMMTIM